MGFIIYDFVLQSAVEALTFILFSLYSRQIYLLASDKASLFFHSRSS
jgi:hypothetical protein